MKGKLFILLAACALAMLLSCSDSTKADNQQPIETKSKLFVTAQDARDGKFLAAKATLRSTDEVLNLTASGKESFLVANGTYRVLFEMLGYASAEGRQTVGANEAAGIHVATNTLLNMPLYPTTASLSGYLVYTNANGKEVPAPGVIVRIYFQGLNIVDSTRYDTTKADGRYSFSNIPAVGTNYQIQTLASVVGGSVFAPGTMYTENHPLLDGSVADYKRLNMSSLSAPNESVYGVASYTEIVEATDTIVFNFSDKVNTIAVNASTVSAEIDDPGPWHIEWGTTTNTLRLIPAAEWEAGAPDICFTNLRFVNGNVLDDVCYNVVIRPVDLSNEKIVLFVNKDSASFTGDDNAATLMWNYVKGASDYELYVAKKGTEKYAQVDLSLMGGWAKDKDSIKVQVLFPNGSSIGKDTLIFKVLAKNARSKTALSAGLLVYDKIGPDFEEDKHDFSKVSTADYLKLYCEYYDAIVDEMVSEHFDAAEFNTKFRLRSNLRNPVKNDNVATCRIYFNEPMDTKKIPTYADPTLNVVGSKDPKGKLKLVFTSASWFDNKTLVVKVVTVAGNVIEPGAVDATYKIANLFDKAGNPFKGTYDKKDDITANSTVLGTINIRFAATITDNPCLGDEIYSEDCADHCGEAPTDEICQTWACNDAQGPNGLNTQECQKFCNGKTELGFCELNWPCELIPGDSKDITSANNNYVRLNDCKAQCTGAQAAGKFQPAYCSSQKWTCGDINPAYDPNGSPTTPTDYHVFGGGFGADSPECNRHCLRVLDENDDVIETLPFPTLSAGSTKRECLANRCLSGNAGSPVSCGTFCKANAAHAGILSSSILGNGEICGQYWGCELGAELLPNAGYESDLCKAQCGNVGTAGINPRDYCSWQSWTCDATEGFGFTSEGRCKEYCMIKNIAPANVTGAGYQSTFCTDASNATSIFGVKSDDLLVYCRLFPITVDNDFNLTLGAADCNSSYNVCEILTNINDPRCRGFCMENPADPVCTKNITNPETSAIISSNDATIFGAGTQEHLNYCRALAALGGAYATYDYLTYACRTSPPGFTACRIYNYDITNEVYVKTSQCVAYCKKLYDSGNTPAYNSTVWASINADCKNTSQGGYTNECALYGDPIGTAGNVCNGFCNDSNKPENASTTECATP